MRLIRNLVQPKSLVKRGTGENQKSHKLLKGNELSLEDRDPRAGDDQLDTTLATTLAGLKQPIEGSDRISKGTKGTSIQGDRNPVPMRGQTQGL